MSRTKSISIPIILLGLGFSIFWTYFYPEFQVHYFSRALVQISETVSLSGSTYIVSNGKIESTKTMPAKESLPILKLAYRKAMAERNPLLAIAGTDPQKLLQAVSVLQSTAQQLAAIQPGDEKSEEDHLYPTEFLRELARLEQYRLMFVNDGSDTAANAYDLQIAKTIAAYQHDLADFKNAFKAAVPSTIKKYATAGSIVSYESTLSALNIFSAGIERTAGTASDRMQCTKGYIWSCSESDLSLTAITVPRQEISQTTDAARAMRVRKIYADAMNMPQLNDLDMFELATSNCISEIGSPIFIIRPTTTMQHDVASFSYPMYVADLRLIDARLHASIPFISYFASRDIRYVPASPVDYYECPMIASDFGKLRNMQSVIELARTKPLSVYASGTDMRNLMALEVGFARGKVPISEQDTLAYAQIARSLILENSLPENVSEHVLSILLQIRDQSAQFDTLIENISLTERGNLYLKSKSVPVALDPTYLFFLRSGVFTLFMAHNPSVTGMHGPLLPPNTISAAEEPYVYYSSLSQSMQTDQEMIKDLKGFFEMHSSPEHVD